MDKLKIHTNTSFHHSAFVLHLQSDFFMYLSDMLIYFIQIFPDNRAYYVQISENNVSILTFGVDGIILKTLF